MSQITSAIPASGPGSGTVTSITFNGGLTATPDPITTTGTATLDQTNLTVQDGTVYWDTGTQRLNTTATGTAGLVLTSNGAGAAPTYQAAAGGGVATITAGAKISNSGTATNPIINVAGTTIHSVQVGTGATGLTQIAVGTTGQVLTGVTGADPVFASPAFVAFPWTDVTGASVALAVNNGYTLDRATSVTATLPASAAYGSIIEICAINTGLGTIAQNANQTIWFSTATHTTTGAGGTLTFTSQYGSIRLLCTTANTDFTVLSSSGTFTYV